MLARAAGLALGFCIFTQAASAQIGPGAPPYGPQTDAAIARVRAGDPEGLTALIALADGGDAGAQTIAASLFVFGALGAPQDGKRGCDYVRRASATRSDAMHVLGECYQYGYGGEKDL
ncbi:MAG TPA: hypothetical protein VF495_24455, partial [Phenylobacterium sp.]